MSDVMSTTKPIVFIKGDDVFASSPGIAERFGKRHDHVLRDIDNWVAKLAKAENDLPNFGEINRTGYFIPSDYIDNGRSYRAFNLNRSGAMLLIFGYNGDEATKVQMAYVAAFDAMEALLRARPKRQTKAEPVNTGPKPIRITGALVNALEKALAHKLRLLPNLSDGSKQLLCREYAGRYGVNIPAPAVQGQWFTGGEVARMLDSDINSLKHAPRYKALRTNLALGEDRRTTVNNGQKEVTQWHWNEAGRDAVLAAFRPAGSVVPFPSGGDDEDVA